MLKITLVFQYEKMVLPRAHKFDDVEDLYFITEGYFDQEISRKEWEVLKTNSTYCNKMIKAPGCTTIEEFEEDELWSNMTLNEIFDRIFISGGLKKINNNMYEILEENGLP